jgi:ATP-binding cassette subfamily F protein uup
MSNILSVHNATKSMGSRTLFEGLSFGLSSSVKTGLVGPNGAGKSTLMKCLAGLDKLDSGSLVWTLNTRLQYISQSPQFKPGETMQDFLFKNQGLDSEDVELQAKMWEFFSRLNLDETDLEKPMTSLSGGGQKKIQIIRAFLADPQVLLMDEPTNHLDVESIMWLEDFLKSRTQMTYLLISHDRLFLQNVVNEIIELNPKYRDGYIRTQGGYAEYQELKYETERSQSVQQQRQENDMRRETAWLRRGAKARQTKQTARINAADQMKDDLEILKSLNRSRRVEIEMSTTNRSPKKLVEVENLKLSRPQIGRVFFEKLNLLVHRHTRLGLIGKNGSGKSSLIQAMLQEAPFAGGLTIEEGKVKRFEELQANHFEQNRSSLLLDKTLLQNICPEGDYVFVKGQPIFGKSYLDRFNFKRNQHDLKVRELSGGEQNRLLIALMMTKNCQLMVLDEPTNDLDFETLDSLKTALDEFEGAILLVSHDRAFLDEVCTELLYFPTPEEGTELVRFSSFLQWQDWRTESAAQIKKKSKEQGSSANSGGSSKKSTKLGYNEQREYDQMEAIVMEKENALMELRMQLELPDVISNPKKIVEVSSQISKLEDEMEKLYLRWQYLESLKSQ